LAGRRALLRNQYFRKGSAHPPLITSPVWPRGLVGLAHCGGSQLRRGRTLTHSAAPAAVGSDIIMSHLGFRLESLEPPAGARCGAASPMTFHMCGTCADGTVSMPAVRSLQTYSSRRR
jgi:hypothetical protein